MLCPFLQQARDALCTSSIMKSAISAKKDMPPRSLLRRVAESNFSGVVRLRRRKKETQVLMVRTQAAGERADRKALATTHMMSASRSMGSVALSIESPVSSTMFIPLGANRARQSRERS